MYLLWLIYKIVSEWEFGWMTWYHRFIRGWKNCDLYTISVLLRWQFSCRYHHRYLQFRFICDKLEDCRKSPKVVSLPIWNVVKSITYKHQIFRFRDFRQSLEQSVNPLDITWSKQNRLICRPNIAWPYTRYCVRSS